MKSKRERQRQCISYLLKGKFNQAYVWKKYINLIQSVEKFLS
ncbi:hypothetical protein [Turicibacter bilis]